MSVAFAVRKTFLSLSVEELLFVKLTLGFLELENSFSTFSSSAVFLTAALLRWGNNVLISAQALCYSALIF